jgi:hypothetical protein
VKLKRIKAPREAKGEEDNWSTYSRLLGCLLADIYIYIYIYIYRERERERERERVRRARVLSPAC